MTKEELEKEAEEKFKISNQDKDREHYYDRMWFKTGYLAGAEPREKRIEELEQQLDFIRDERNKFQEKCEDIELNYYCDHIGGCKVQELETENNKLLDVINNQDVKIADLEKIIEQMQDAKCISCTDLGGMLLKITDLEKENAELKRDKEDLIFIRNQNAKCMCEDKENLTKAKDIIKELIDLGKIWLSEEDDDYSFIGQAEQFLQEIENDRRIF